MRSERLSSLPLAELEKATKAYPWYAEARREIFRRLSEKGEEYRKEGLRGANIYIYPRIHPFVESYFGGKDAEECQCRDIYEISDDLEGPRTVIEFEMEREHVGPNLKTKDGKEIYVVGGDYFSNEEIKSVQSDGSIMFKGFSPLSAPRMRMTESDSSDFKDETFYTETLARIYAEQQLYSRANEVYEKLILLYPEKSTYFASLKEQIKKYL